MNFNKHYDVAGRHAFLSPSKHHWLGYDSEKLRSVYFSSIASTRGIRIHELAQRCILLNVKLPKNATSLNQFVNDAIGYRMSPEQILFYSYNAYGTADAVSFRNKFLRIHDLKTGYGRVYIDQLKIYAALFCLEYREKPKDIDIELRLYQTSKIVVDNPHPSSIKRIMEKIMLFDKKIEEFKSEEEPWL